jgi:ribulose-phosphate 3-epimerase
MKSEQIQKAESGGLGLGHSLAAPAVRIAPSLLAADFSRLAEEVHRIEDAGAEVLHLDVMDGHFVPNISFGPGLIAALREHSRMFFDTHLMISEPGRYAKAFADAGADLITFHVEATDNPRHVLETVRECGVRVGVALNPTTDVERVEPLLPDIDLVLVMSVWPGFGGQTFIGDVLPKVERLAGLLGSHQRLEIDGGIDKTTIQMAVRAGADTIVAGTAIFGEPDPVAAMNELAELAAAARNLR